MSGFCCMATYQQSFKCIINFKFVDLNEGVRGKKVSALLTLFTGGLNNMNEIDKDFGQVAAIPVTVAG